MQAGDAHRILAKGGMDFFSDGAAHTSVETASSHVACSHWEGLWIDAGVTVSAITPYGDAVIFGMAGQKFTNGGYFPIIFNAITADGLIGCVRKDSPT